MIELCLSWQFSALRQPTDASDYARPSADDAISEFTIAQARVKKAKDLLFTFRWVARFVSVQY